MRSLAEVAAATINRPAAEATYSAHKAHATPAPQAPVAMWLRRLWERMVALYGHAWVSVNGVTPHAEGGALSMAGSTWSGVLAGLTAQQIGDGVKACIAEGAEFPPSAPRFRGMCFGIPSFAAVESELRTGNPSPFTRAVWADLDAFLYRQVSAEKAERMLRAAYDLTREKVMQGMALPEPPVAEIEHQKPEFKRASPEVAARHCAEIRALLGMGNSQ